MKEKNIYKLFKFSLALKGLQALAEIIAGCVFYSVSISSFSFFIQKLVSSELIEDPNNSIFSYIFNSAQNFSLADKSYFAFYLLSHGFVKFVLIGGILKNKVWAYPVFLVVQVIFIIYQTTSAIYRHSIILAVITLFDLLILWLVWHEYKIKQKHNLQQAEIGF